MGLLSSVKGALKGLGGAITGGIFGLAGGALSNEANADAVRRQIKYQREFAQHGIRWRVEDAKAAGLHPLYALGAQTPSYSPVMAQDSIGPALADMGQNITRAVAAQQTKQERTLQDLAIMQAMKALDETDARIGVLQAERDKLRSDQLGAALPISFNRSPIKLDAPEFPAQPSPFTGGIVHEDALRPGFTPPGAGIVNVKPAEQVTSSTELPGVAAGYPDAFRRFNWRGLPLLLPGGMQGDASEALETLAESPLLMMMVYRENVQAFGPEWAKAFKERYSPGNWLSEWWKEVRADSKARGEEYKRNLDRAVGR